MKKITVNTIIALALGSMCLSSCIGSFSLTNNVLNWNKRAAAKRLALPPTQHGQFPLSTLGFTF